MKLEELDKYYNKFKFGEDIFHNLMKRRVKEILLISNFYDAYILEQDGRLSEQLYGEYKQLNLTNEPRITTIPISKSKDITEKLKTKEFDLVIIMMRMGEITPFELSRDIKEHYPNLPILLLLNKQSYIDVIHRSEDKLYYIDDVFLWTGDAKLFLGMIKSVEDKWNIDHDTTQGLVRVVLLIESSIDYYSLFLPLLYQEILDQTQRLISSELNEANKRLRMKARPKVILVHDYEDALYYFQKYKEYIIGIITNVNLKVNGQFNIEGGLNLVKTIRSEEPELPILMQSAEESFRKDAEQLNTQFLYKYSKSFFSDMRSFITDNLGFGDFVFKTPSGKVLRRVKNLEEFEHSLKDIPEGSIIYHADRNHFSAWLIARGEMQIAKKVRALKVQDFPTSVDLRNFLILTIHEIRRKLNRGKVINFDPSFLHEEDKIVKLGDGSLGGKGRGIAFLNAMLVTLDVNKDFDNVDIRIPKTAILGTNEYDWFLEHNNIMNSIAEKSDQEIADIFFKGTLSPQLNERLKILIEKTEYPLAVRSSGLLEDSQSQPFAGIYRTYMLPNNNEDNKVRLTHLQEAIKLVFASPFQENARCYIESIHFKIDEEKMAVVVQEIVGSTYDGYYFPQLSGVAQSYNYYPTFIMKHTDGIASIALGLGKSVVDGERAYRYCPRHPKVDMLRPTEIVENNQREFYALDMNDNTFDLSKGDDATLERKRITNAYKDGIFQPFTSVWDYEHFAFLDGKFIKGPRVITFRNVIRFNQYPLSDIINRMLEIGEIGLGVPVEIEFAMKFQEDGRALEKPIFYILQIRPLMITKENINIELDKLSPKELVLLTTKGMGNGIVQDVKDIIYLDPTKFESTKTLEMKDELEFLNKEMKKKDARYILIGLGRWGTNDRFLGVPARWGQIDQAAVIVEVGMQNLPIEPSQGSHFFHNLVAMNVGYFTIPYTSKQDFVDWAWLNRQKAEHELTFFRHVSSQKEFLIKMDGKKGVAVIYK
ncbi:MAG: hypothetical protein B1H05_03305 [Candidatus Cloacimonas sp. 4484_140]|nr:MAG: hypothetical protein B1H05_03305 [Candidatus Cloacimonas sp. 4484_140]